jgi:hypothetical protein
MAWFDLPATPPALPAVDPYWDPTAGIPVSDPWNPQFPTGAVPLPAQRPTTLGNVVPDATELPANVPLPVPKPAGAAAAQSVAKGGTQQSALANALKGVVTPVAPDVQKVTHSPSLPQTKPIAGGLGDLMAMLGVAPPKPHAGLQLPSTLQQALGGR